jgi:hypothetical protein
MSDLMLVLTACNCRQTGDMPAQLAVELSWKGEGSEGKVAVAKGITGQRDLLSSLLS